MKFDGWRMQLHKAGDRVVVFSRNGVDMTGRFPMIRDRVLSLSASTAIIDAELVACDSDGKPDFKALMDGQRENLCGCAASRLVGPIGVIQGRAPHCRHFRTN